ncbi:unnamed protein product [Penicillium camemberti]|uniref:Str. FM013 n=1 Tax=Penicillium camemberti (strain FM 013) TaxID=1429867 RepID=A0A0G4PM15_PENC3|nr:unnamed protein product [Penicillium camemberti]
MVRLSWLVEIVSRHWLVPIVFHTEPDTIHILKKRKHELIADLKTARKP